MGKVASSMSMSLDGFVTGPEVSTQHRLGVGGDVLHEWMGAQSQDDQDVLREMVEGAGAIVMGRDSYDLCAYDVWGDGGPVGDTPCFVLTHHPPAAAPPVFTFVTDGIKSAIAAAQEVAGDRVVGLHGASVPQQALAAGLLDEIQVHVVPVLLGGGVRLFDLLGAGSVELVRDRVVAGASGVTHLRYRVAKVGGDRNPM